MGKSHLGSRSDLEALRRSHRGKVVGLAALVAAALGLASWDFARPEGDGNREDISKVFVVSSATSGRYAEFLSSAGFEVVQAPYPDWVAKAKRDVPDLEADGVGAILALADRFGFGYVVFEKPSELDLSDVEVDDVPDLREARFAAFSVGDFAFPHRVTIPPQAAPSISDPTVPLLQALFAQEGLAVLGAGNDDPTLRVIRLRDRHDVALERLGRGDKAEALVRGIEAETHERLEAEEGPAKVERWTRDPFEKAWAAPIADGSVLVGRRGFRVVSPDGFRPELDERGAEQVTLERPQATPGEGVVCAFADGLAAADEAIDYVASQDGSVVLTRSLSGGLVAFERAPDDPTACPCGYVRRGSVPHADEGLAALGVPSGHGRVLVARAGRLGALGVVAIAEAGRTETSLLGMLEGAELRDPLWLDARHLAVAGRHEDGTERLYLLRVDDPLRVLEVPSTLFGGDAALGDVTGFVRLPVPSDTPRVPEWVVAGGSAPRSLYHVVSQRSLDDLFARPLRAKPEKKAALSPSGASLPVVLDSNDFVTRRLTHQGHASSPEVSPDRRRVVFVLHGQVSKSGPSESPSAVGDLGADTELAVVRLDDPVDQGVQVLTRNSLADLAPRFASDEVVVFHTGLAVPRTAWALEVLRRVQVRSSNAAP